MKLRGERLSFRRSLQNRNGSILKLSCAKAIEKSSRTIQDTHYKLPTNTHTAIEDISFIISSKARVSSACFWVCNAIFSENFRGFAMLEIINVLSAYGGVPVGHRGAGYQPIREHLNNMPPFFPSPNANISIISRQVFYWSIQNT